MILASDLGQDGYVAGRQGVGVRRDDVVVGVVGEEVPDNPDCVGLQYVLDISDRALPVGLDRSGGVGGVVLLRRGVQIYAEKGFVLTEDRPLARAERRGRGRGRRLGQQW